MSKIFKHGLRIYNNFSKGDRNTIILISSIILIILVAIAIINNLTPKSKYTHEEYDLFLKQVEKVESSFLAGQQFLFAFDPNTITDESLDSLNLPGYVKRNIISYRNAGGRFYSAENIRKIYGMNDSIYEAIKDYIFIETNETEIKKKEPAPKFKEGFFDPNTASLIQLKEFGLNSQQAGNILAYRNNGGIFYEKTDLMKIYGIDSLDYKQIERNIQITKKSPPSKEVGMERELLNIDLNRADTTELMKLRGIGSVYAGRIIKYRNLLGGFYNKSQLLEVYNFPEETFNLIQPEIFADSASVKKIRLNFADYTELIRHPYLNKNQVEAILNFRNKNGAYKNVRQLELDGLIDNETFRRISPYLTCR